MTELKKIPTKVFALFKRLGFYIRQVYIRTAALTVRARRGQALELHPTIGRWASIFFKVILFYQDTY